jgi:hypothetical protein
MKTLKSLTHYLIVWYANNFAAPFWMIGHYHFASNNYEQDEQILGMIGINLITVLGIFLDWRMQQREAEAEIQTEAQESLKYFVVPKDENNGAFGRSPVPPNEINDHVEFGLKNRNLNLSDLLFVREDETYLYVYYKSPKK